MQTIAEDRRQHKRYKLDNSLSIASLGTFQVTDISRGGFCFKCPSSTHISDFWDTDILTSAVFLDGFPAIRVWVSLAENGNHEYLPTIVGVKFGKLTPKQESVLLELLDNLESNSGITH
ncbi:MAG: PilZ domain-containing protein [Desulfocapsaceae bacterium]